MKFLFILPVVATAFSPHFQSQRSSVALSAQSPFDNFKDFKFDVSSLGKLPKKTVEEPIVDDGFILEDFEDDDFEMSLEEALQVADDVTVSTPKLKISSGMDRMQSTVKTWGSKAEELAQDEKVRQVQETVQDLASKTKNFMEAGQVQEISSKAGDFAKDMLGAMWAPVGEKLKQLKEEKEQSKMNEASSSTFSDEEY